MEKITKKEIQIIFDALDIYAVEIYDATFCGDVDDYGTKRQVTARLKAVKKLEAKLNVI